MKIVISQPMFIPWLGLFEQIKMADIYINYDDVQMPKGRSFINRVQVLDGNTQRWMTASIDKKNSGPLINSTLYSNDLDWRKKHLNILNHTYSNRPYFKKMMQVANKIYSNNTVSTNKFNSSAIEYICKEIGIDTPIINSSEIHSEGRSSEKLLNICKHFGATTYITGHGALNYIDYKLFENNSVSIEYIDYALPQYDQQNTKFTPYVTILDTLASCGDNIQHLFQSKTKHWRQYIK